MHGNDCVGPPIAASIFEQHGNGLPAELQTVDLARSGLSGEHPQQARATASIDDYIARFHCLHDGVPQVPHPALII